MPKQTFFNLPDEKRRMIEKAAMEEFAEYGFDNSNMNRIVAESNISKGSFYQYFEDKRDLYFHLIDTVVARKMKVLEPVLNHYQQYSFTHNLEELFRLGLKFADSDPKLYRLGEDFTSKKPELIEEFLNKYSPVAQDVYGSLLENARGRGELRDDIDIPLTKSFINAMVNQTTLGLVSQPKKIRDHVINQLLVFIKRAVLRS